jgi:predicted transcriptional regulator
MPSNHDYREYTITIPKPMAKALAMMADAVGMTEQAFIKQAIHNQIKAQYRNDVPLEELP